MSRQRKEVNITLATTTTPALSEVGKDDKERLHLTPAEFAHQLKVLGDETRDLVKVARKVGALKSGEHYRMPNGETVGTRELNAMVTAHNRKLKQLKKNYVARSKRKSKVGQVKAGRKGEGFGKASFLAQPLIDFLRSANFGNVAGTSTPLRDVLAPALEYGILSRAILTPLLTIYEFVNGHRFEVDGKKFFRAGPEMERFLGPYLTALEAEDRAKSDADLVDKKGNTKPRFSRKQFVFNRLQSLVTPGLVPNATLSDEQKRYVEDQGIKDMLAEIQSAVSRTLKQVNPEKK